MLIVKNSFLQTSTGLNFFHSEKFSKIIVSYFSASRSFLRVTMEDLLRSGIIPVGASIRYIHP